MPTVAAIVLAAGRGCRFGPAEHESKVLATIGDEPLVRRVARTILASSARPVVVVTGHAAKSVEAVLGDLPVVRVSNTEFAAGMAGSLRIGVAALPVEVDGVLVCLADMPHVTTATLDRLVAAFARAAPEPDAVVPCYEGRRGNPLLLGRRMFAAISNLDGDEGARRLIAEQGRHVLTCEVDDPGILLDVDTQDMLRVARERD